MKLEVNSTAEMALSMQTLKSLKDGKAEVLMKLEGLKATIDSSDGRTVSFDTDSPESLPEKIRVAFQKVFKDGLTRTLDPLGHASDSKVPESWKEYKQTGGIGGLNLDGLAGKGSMTWNVVFPEEPVAKGKTWKGVTYDTDLARTGKMKIVFGLTYDGPVTRGGRQLEKITIRPKVAVRPDTKADRKLTVKLRESRGTLYFDNRAGHITEMQMPTDADIDSDADGMHVRIRLDESMTVKLQKDSK